MSLTENQTDQLDMLSPLSEMNLGQVLAAMRIQELTATTQVCADFSGMAVGTQFPALHQHVINNIRFSVYYSGGSRISEFPGNAGKNFLEMVGAGAVVIDLPVRASRIQLEIIQAGPDPIAIHYFNDWGRQRIGTVHTTVKDAVETLSITGDELTTISMQNPELLIGRVCYTV